ncbi:MAG: small multi-drug export protein [Parcubacteria group bacterium]|nr:small multi-drug export protein [Parcubacteria group bacterium]
MTPELKTFLIAMSPIVELRGAIPWALHYSDMPVWSAYVWSVLGNLVPLCLIVGTGNLFLKFFTRHMPFLGSIASRVFEHTRRTHQSTAERWGKNATVLLLVATPIPFVGGWTGAIAAFAFGMSLRQAFPLLVIGSMLGGAVVTMVSLGLFSVFS